MKALKSLVIGMGLLIVIGIAFVGVGLSRGKAKPEPLHVTSNGGDAFETELAVPRDATVQQVIAADDRIVLRYPDKLLILDARTGKLDGTVTLVPDKK